MPAPAALAGLPKPILFGLYGALGGLLGAVLLGEPAWQLLKPPLAAAPPQVAVGASTSVKAYPGTKNSFIVRVARERFTGPVTVAFGKPPAGVSLPPLMVIAPDQDQVEAVVSVETDVPPQASQVAVSAEALNGTLSAATTLEIEVIAPPPALALTVPSSLSVYAKGEGKFTASVARRGYPNEVAIHIEGLPDSITTAPATIPRNANEVEVTLRAAAGAPLKATKLTVVAEPSPAGLRAAGIADGAAAGLKATAPTQVEVQTPPIAPVDVVFVLDVTASMQWALNDLKNGIGKFADALSNAQLNFRLGLVTFQDLTIPGEMVEVIQFKGEPFTSDAALFRDKVGGLKAEGGGDIPESSLEGVMEALNLPFRQGATRVLLLITDAPPKVVPESDLAIAVRKVAGRVKEMGIDTMNLVVDPFDKATYEPLREGSALKNGGVSYDIRDLVRNEGGFEELLTKFGTDVTTAARARSSDAKPQIAPPPPPPRVGAAAALKAAEAPPVPSVKGVQASGQFAAGDRGRLTLAIGVWMGAIAAMLCLALLSGQHHYLRGRFPSVLRGAAGFLGGTAVGIVGGAAGQGLYMLEPVLAFQVLGWMLLGGLAGCGLSLFIPNLKWVYGLIGGAIGGAAGGLGYIEVTTVAGELVGRWVGGLIVGLCIGVMVAVVEAAFRRAWLEVKYGARETICVNLGPEPVKVGGDARLCTVWARGASPLALRFFIRDGHVICDDAVMKRESAVGDGYAKEVGNVTVTVRTGLGSATPAQATPARVPPLAPAKPTPAPAAKAPVMDDFDLLPMPIKSPPPPPAQPAAKPTAPTTPTPVAQPAPRPSIPAPAKPTRPAAPAFSKPTPPKPPTPSAPGVVRPAAPAPAPPKASTPQPPSAPAKPTAKHPDACPTCGRVNPGKPRSRYCMVCDQTY
jgi:hypothetical protein